MIRKTLAERFWPKVKKSPGCWLWSGVHSNQGYGKIWTGDTSRPSQCFHAHRVAWELTYGPIPKGRHVLHRCDTPACVRPDHLFLGTQADNIRDMVQKGRSRASKLSIHDARMIRFLYRVEERNQSRLAELYQVSSQSVNDIVLGHSYPD